MDTTTTLTALMEHPAVAPVTIAVGVIVTIVTAFTRAGGAVGAAWQSWIDSKRRAREAATDADLRDMKRQLAYLDQRIRAMSCDMQRRDSTLSDHARWDTDVMQVLAQHGIALPAPPPLWPPPMTATPPPPDDNPKEGEPE